MAISHSPLRYPGGKQILARVLAHLLSINGRAGGIYAEPYAGGAGAALALLFGGHVDQLMLNDADPRINAFWSSVLNETDEFVEMVRKTPLTIVEWLRQRAIYNSSGSHSLISVGFATFYLNRCNRSGIIANAGVIGGLNQAGKWKLGARFNREDLVKRIQRIARYRRKIRLSKFDAITFIRRIASKPRLAGQTFVYLDPPYYEKGSQLYLNHYGPNDHAKLSKYLQQGVPFKWVMSYDNVVPIKNLYRDGFSCVPFNLTYSARHPRVASELLIHDKTLLFPKAWRRRVPDRFISAADRIALAMPI